MVSGVKPTVFDLYHPVVPLTYFVAVLVFYAIVVCLYVINITLPV